MPWREKSGPSTDQWYDWVRYYDDPNGSAVFGVLRCRENHYVYHGYNLTPGWWAFEMQDIKNNNDPGLIGPFETEEVAMVTARLTYS